MSAIDDELEELEEKIMEVVETAYDEDAELLARLLTTWGHSIRNVREELDDEPLTSLPDYAEEYELPE